MGKGANLAILIVIIAVALGAYNYYYLPEGGPEPLPPDDGKISFEEGLNAMNSLFEENGVPLFTELPSNQKIVALNSSSLNKLSSALEGYRQEIEKFAEGQNKAALVQLNSIYLLELDYYQAIKENENTPQFDYEKDTCLQLNVLRQNDSDLEALVNASRALDVAMDNFIQSYPSQNQVAGLLPLNFNEAELAEAINTQKESTAYFEESCIAEASQ